jgi:hypothetical protein
MKKFFNIMILFFSCSLTAAEAHLEKEYLDNATGKGFYLTTIKKDCDTNVYEDEKYTKKAKLLCESNGFLLLNFNSSFVNGGCSVEYLFKCDITYPQKKAREEKAKSENIDKIKSKCASLGYEKDSPKFRNCVMELIK